LLLAWLLLAATLLLLTGLLSRILLAWILGLLARLLVGITHSGISLVER
jgi:hypothetical protein